MNLGYGLLLLKVHVYMLCVLCDKPNDFVSNLICNTVHVLLLRISFQMSNIHYKAVLDVHLIAISSHNFSVLYAQFFSLAIFSCSYCSSYTHMHTYTHTRAHTHTHTHTHTHITACLINGKPAYIV